MKAGVEDVRSGGTTLGPDRTNPPGQGSGLGATSKEGGRPGGVPVHWIPVAVWTASSAKSTVLTAERLALLGAWRLVSLVFPQISRDLDILLAASTWSDASGGELRPMRPCDSEWSRALAADIAQTLYGVLEGLPSVTGVSPSR